MTDADVTGQSEADSGHNDENRRASNNINNTNNKSSVEKEVISQALLYMSSCFLTYIFPMTLRVIRFQGK